MKSGLVGERTIIKPSSLEVGQMARIVTENDPFNGMVIVKTNIGIFVAVYCPPKSGHEPFKVTWSPALIPDYNLEILSSNISVVLRND